MSTESGDPVANEPAERLQRNPVERVIVWGGIGLLLVIVLIEARAQRGYAMSLGVVQAALADNEEAQLALDEARELMTLAPSETVEKSDSVYLVRHQFSWFSLFKSGQYEITLSVTPGEDAQVLSFSTPEAAEEKVAPILEDDPDAESASEGFGNQGSSFRGLAGGGVFSGGGFSEDGFSNGGGFQPRPDPLLAHLDADTDGELSAEEIAAAGDALLALDGNGDGELSEEEFDPDGRGRRDGAFGQGGFGSGDFGSDESQSSRPRRPPIEE